MDSLNWYVLTSTSEGNSFWASLGLNCLPPGNAHKEFIPVSSSFHTITQRLVTVKSPQYQYIYLSHPMTGSPGSVIVELRVYYPYGLSRSSTIQSNLYCNRWPLFDQLFPFRLPGLGLSPASLTAELRIPPHRSHESSYHSVGYLEEMNVR